MKIAIIGAGFCGMAAAYDLIKAGHNVTIFEAEDHVGGLASGFKEPGWEWSVEKFYHHWFASDKHLLGLIKELGWENQVIFPRPLTVMYHNGMFYPFDSIIKALLFPGLGLVLWGRLVLGKMYNVSSALGAQLYADQHLITHGPYAIVRNPMYVGIIAATLGGLLIYRTWSLVFALTFFGLVIRARREEQVLAAEFGQQ